jgi:hypothetical protein
MRTRFLTIFAASLAVFGGLLMLPAESSGQRRDYLTEAEIELVRDAQEIDKRIDVLAYAARRRMLVLKNQSPEKEKESWGELPKGPRLALLIDVERILQKSIDDIDDVASRNSENRLFPKAVHNLADACRDFLPDLGRFLDSAAEEKERGSLLNSIEACNQVIEASARVPNAPAGDQKKKKN